MFHYIKWRPTSVIKKNIPPSETEFLAKRVTLSPLQLKLSIRATGQKRKQCFSQQGISEEKINGRESEHFSKRQITPPPAAES